MTKSLLHSTYLRSYDLFVRAYDKHPTHLLIQPRDYKELIQDTFILASSSVEGNTYHGLFVTFITSGPPRVALL